MKLQTDDTPLLSSQPAPADPFLEWLNRMCVIVGLFFFALAIFTFLLCSWNPKISNTARLHLCLNLSLSHLLLLWNDRYIEHEVGIEMQCIRNEQINMIWLII